MGGPRGGGRMFRMRTNRYSNHTPRFRKSNQIAMLATQRRPLVAGVNGPAITRTVVLVGAS
ncbi:hypothetical protein D3C72_2374920 [compost metagenome]